MKICIDARNPSFGGTYTYVVSLLETMFQMAPEDEYLVLYDEVHGSLGLRGVEERIIAGHKPVQILLWNQTSLAPLLESEQVDIYHSLKQLSAPRTRAHTVYTFHSTSQFVCPKLWKKYEILYWRWAARACARKASAIVAVSQADKANIVRFTQASEEGIYVINLAGQMRFHPVSDRTAVEEVQARFSLPERFVLFVGNLTPFKNVANLVRAFHKGVVQNQLPHDLVLAGEPRQGSDEIFALIESLGISDRVHSLGFIHEELPVLYSLADLFVFPSLYEAFCLPPLEAMRCGTAVVTSDVGGVPEVVGEAAVKVDPLSVHAIADAMIRVLSDDGLRKGLIAKGFERAAMFSWEKTARETLSLYERIAASSLRKAA